MAAFVCITLVADRFHDLRYLLHFSGLRSSSYILGISLGDTLLCIIPNLFFVILGCIFGIDIFRQKYHLILLTCFVYSFTFV